MADEAKARMVDRAEVAEINKANEADLTDDASKVDKADKVANKAGANNAGVFIETPLLLPFSLTKYSAIFAEVKGCFQINNNQLLGFEAAVDNVHGRLNDGNEIDNQLGTVKLAGLVKDLSKSCSLRSQRINQLERVVANGD